MGITEDQRFGGDTPFLCIQQRLLIKSDGLLAEGINPPERYCNYLRSELPLACNSRNLTLCVS